MTFLFGGAHQGMEEYARAHCGAAQICTLDEGARAIDFSRGAIAGLDRFVLGCVRRGERAVDYFAAREDAWAEAVLIGTDFSCGLVPMDAELRLWREENGRLNNYLSARAERVVRLFCGLPQVLK